MQHFIVPVDGSTESWRVVDVAVELARRCAGRIEIVEVVFDPSVPSEVERRLATELDERSIVDVDVTSTVELSTAGVADAIRETVAKSPGSTVMMASRGRGRSAALLGSVAEELLRQLDGPILIVGPQSEVSDFSGPIIVTADGSDTSEAAIPIAAAWSLELGAAAHVVQVVTDGGTQTDDDGVPAYLASLAGRFSTLSGRSAESTVLTGRDIDATVAEYARSIGASMIVTSTHGRSGTSRFVLGSTASGFVRCAPCPVLAIQPKHFA